MFTLGRRLSFDPARVVEHPDDARLRGWLGPMPEPSLPGTLIGVRLDLATWAPSQPPAPCLGPLRAVRFQASGPWASVEAMFPDGARLRVPWRPSGPAPGLGFEGWAAFGPDAVLRAAQDDRA